MNLRTALAGEDAKIEKRRRSTGRLRTVAESNNGNRDVTHLPITPCQYFETRRPGLSEKYGAPVREEIDKNDIISVIDINQAFFAAALGAEGSPDAPMIYMRIEGRFYQYQPDDGIFKIVSDAALAAQISEEFLGCVRACKSGTVNTDNLEYRFRDYKNILGTVNTAKGQLEVSPDYFKNNPKEKIAFNNGVLQLSNNALLDHSPAHRFRSKLAVSFDPSAKCPMFERFLRDALEDEDVDLYQRYCGQTLTGENIAQKIALFVGNAGTGKTTGIKIHQGIIGADNCAMLRTALLTERFELSRYFNKHFLYAPDVSGDFLNHKGAAVLKSLSGNDPMSIEFKNSNEVPQMVGNKNIAITCNSRLVVRLDGDIEAWRRRLIIFSYHKEKPKNVIADLDRRILGSEASGIVNWMLEGLAKLRADGWELKMTATQQSAVDSLLLESDSLSLFVKEQLEKSDDAQLTAHDCYAVYGEFCNSRGWAALGRNKFGQMVGDIVMRQYGLTTRNDIPDPLSRKAQRGWRGLTLKGNGPIAEKKTLTFDDPERQRAWDSWEDTTQ